MDKKMMSSAKNVALGLAMGTAATVAGAYYLKDNEKMVRSATNKVKKSGRIISRAGDDVVKELYE